MHIASSAVFSVLVVAMMVLSAVAYRGWFRVYAVATVAVVMAFGMASAVAIQGIDENDTPWAGAFERINAYAYFAWLVVLAVVVIRDELNASRVRPESREARPGVPEGSCRAHAVAAPENDEGPGHAVSLAAMADLSSRC